MNDEDVATVETTLDVELPENYKEILLQVVKKFGDAPYPFPFPHDCHLVAGSKELIDLNHLLWSSPDGAWSGLAEPVDYFFIGEDGCGNYFCIDPDDDDSPVFFLCHDPPSFEEQASSIQGFVSQLAFPPPSPFN